jgi:hypothetical protein
LFSRRGAWRKLAEGVDRVAAEAHNLVDDLVFRGRNAGIGVEPLYALGAKRG